MTAFLYIFATLGFIAVLWHLFRATVRAARQGVNAFVASEVAKTRANRGDLTGMEEANAQSRVAGRARWRSAAQAGLWLTALALPPVLLESPAPVYAVYVVFWLLDRRFVRTFIRRA